MIFHTNQLSTSNRLLKVETENYTIQQNCPQLLNFNSTNINPLNTAEKNKKNLNISQKINNTPLWI